jgi:hypothetical protein
MRGDLAEVLIEDGNRAEAESVAAPVCKAGAGRPLP